MTKTKKRASPQPLDPDASHFNIDEYDLVRHLVFQPGLARRVNRELADARLELEEAKAAHDVAAAEVEKAIRSRPERYGLDKVTEAAVKAAIPLHPKYKETQRAVLEAKHRVDLLSADSVAAEHKKRALEKLVDLHGQAYFSKPSVKDEAVRAAVDAAGKRFPKRKKQS